MPDTQHAKEMLGSLVALNASNDTCDQLSKGEQRRRDAALLEKITDLHGLTWHAAKNRLLLLP